jgi:uncharacterized protein YndB with AHSA1/START domain
LGHEWEQRQEIEVDATPEQVWAAIATGPGIDSWYMGRTEVEPGEGGTVRTDLGGFDMRSTVTGWEPLRRFAYRGEEGEDGRFIAYEFLVEGRASGSTVIRVVANGFLPGDDWEAEYEAMTEGGNMYLRTLAAYLSHFAGRTGSSVGAAGPPVPDREAAWVALRDGLGLARPVAEGDRVRLTPAGLAPIDGVVDHVSRNILGVRGPDALYRFISSPWSTMVLGHHLFGDDQREAVVAWRSWLAGRYD